MTSEEKRRIADCRIAVVGATKFIDSIKAELQQLGFESIQIISSYDKQPAISNFDVIAENVNEGTSRFIWSCNAKCRFQQNRRAWL